MDATEELLRLQATVLDAPLAGIDEVDVALEGDVVVLEIEGHRREDEHLSNLLVSRFDPSAPEALRARRTGVGELTLGDVRRWVGEHYRPRAP